MSFQNYWLFLPACFAINMAFGPNNMLSLSNGARDGVRCAILAASGRLLAFAVMITIAGLGLGALLLASETLFSILKFGGAAYLVWLGIKLFRSGPMHLSGSSGDAGGTATAASGETQRAAGTAGTAGVAYAKGAGATKDASAAPHLAHGRAGAEPLLATLGRLARQEFLVAAGNPKAILVFTAFFPQFVDRSAYGASFAILGATFLLFEGVAIAIYALIGSRIGKRMGSLAAGAQRLRWLNRTSGILMVGFGLLLAFMRRPAT